MGPSHNYGNSYGHSLYVVSISNSALPNHPQNQHAANQKSHAVYIKKLHPEACHDGHPFDQAQGAHIGSEGALSGFESIHDL